MQPIWRGGLIALFGGALTFGLLFGGTRLTTYARVQTPLVRELRAIPGVKAVHFAASGPHPEIRLDLSSGADLESVLHRARAEKAQAGEGARLVIRDNTDARLEQAARSMMFDVAEASRTGRFAALPAQLQKIGTARGVNVHVSTDRRYIYLELADGAHFKDLVLEVTP